MLRIQIRNTKRKSMILMHEDLFFVVVESYLIVCFLFSNRSEKKQSILSNFLSKYDMAVDKRVNSFTYSHKQFTVGRETLYFSFLLTHNIVRALYPNMGESLWELS